MMTFNAFHNIDKDLLASYIVSCISSSKESRPFLTNTDMCTCAGTMLSYNYMFMYNY